MTSTQAFTTTLAEMAQVQHILDSDATVDEYLEGLREAASDVDLAPATDDTELSEADADTILAHFRREFMGDEDA